MVARTGLGRPLATKLETASERCHIPSIFGHSTACAIFPTPSLIRKNDSLSLKHMAICTNNLSLRQELTELIMKYKWQTPDDGKRMLGWLACALVSDSMSHRPHVWLSGYPGKTWFMNHVQDPIHQFRYVLHRSPAGCKFSLESLGPQVVDWADYQDSHPTSKRDIRKAIQACRAACGRWDMCGDFGPLSFSACLMSYKQPPMTRYETRQFAPVRLGPEIPHEEFSRYETKVDDFLNDVDGRALELQELILESAQEIADLAIQIEEQIAVSGANAHRQIEIIAIRSALSAGWQWWSGTNEILGYWKGERPIVGTPE